MKSDPLTTALRSVAETKHLLEALLISSETFEYAKAKKTLTLLHRKMKELGRLQAEMETLVHNREPNIQVVNFRAAPQQVAQ
jgi:t-SNARE complex subunit (syntaxin)